ncbi:MAG: TolC family protein [Saprospiraceae bacterium]
MIQNIIKNKLFIPIRIDLQRNIYFAVLMFTLSLGLSQSPIPLEEAFAIAKENNHKVRAQNLSTAFHQKSIGSVSFLTPTQITAEYGQINSFYRDNGFSVQQGFKLPFVYLHQKAEKSEQLKSAQNRRVYTIKQVEQNIELVYEKYTFLAAKIELLQQWDSLYKKLETQANIRFQSGESNVLETLNIQQKVEQNQILLQQTKTELDLVIQEFQWILNAKTFYIPTLKKMELRAFNTLIDPSFTANHPLIRIAEQEINIAKAVLQNVSDLRYPEITLDYQNMSMRGTGADDLIYGKKDRFHNIQLGVSIPILHNGLSAQKKANEILVEQKSEEFFEVKKEMETKIQQVNITVRETIRQVKTFENTLLPNAALIEKTALTMYKSGEINYLDFMIIIEKSFETKMLYLQTVALANEQIIGLNYLTLSF